MNSKYEQLFQEVRLSLAISRVCEQEELLDQAYETDDMEFMHYAHEQLADAELELVEAIEAEETQTYGA